MGKSGRLKRRPTPSSKEKSGGEVASVKDGQVPAKKKTKAQSLGKGSKQPKRRAQEAQELEATQIQNIRDSAAGSSRLNETFEVEFEFFDPEEDDFHSVRDLLCSGTLGSLDLDFSSLANSIVDQVNIGTMVKSGVEEAQQTQTQEAASEEDDVTLCGMLTILNLKQFAEEAWCKTLLALLKLRLDKQLQQYILGPAQASGKEQVGLIISERFVNLPLEVIPAMHNVILEDISWSCSTEYCPPEERPFYFFTHFICLARCHSLSAAAESEGQTFQHKDGSRLLFSRAEELALAQAASFVSSFSQPSKEGPSSFQSQPGSSKKKRKAEQGGSVIKGQERLAVLWLTRQAYESAVKSMRESLKAST
ncbi:unnamed protein product [Cladocopium goreaui]|uniref:Protein BCCIP homolog n=1 Tax=Cladocopium goreaui TaxID=2562237 RepID=A0A9P1DJR4_9DINO|nr:unnamed protein product [Cladocopium goreaui]CAI4010816.1 unnamed protein product [Cladocopium goreaui]|mmetsp:Transcript_28935/g.62946  ORF Transcript_28935/g.62946 Transcript_28935/m.62946 type:complete len:364 (+) Transcript_28935:30-1121(+)